MAKNRKCTICGKPVILIPSAEERAKKDITGKTAKYYLDLFPNHAQCVVDKRESETRELLKRITK